MKTLKEDILEVCYKHNAWIAGDKIEYIEECYTGEKVFISDLVQPLINYHCPKEEKKCRTGENAKDQAVDLSLKKRI